MAPPPCISNLNVTMVHPHRPFPVDGDGDGNVGGPTSRQRRYTVGHLYDAQYQLHQPFETQTRNHNTVAFKFPGGGGMAASVGFPFTNAQWKELERQAMIYKYMVASVPVPPHLLIPPDFRNFGSNGLGSRQRSGGSDLELGRCKRTDGKKWRCSRDAAPDQKYCERHLHRGRPRSRKHVELLPNDNVKVINLNHNAENNKKARLVTATAHSDSGWQLTGANSLPYHQNHASVIKSDKLTTFDSDSPFILAYNQPRELDWLVNGGGPFPVTPTNVQDRQWRDRAAESSSINYQEEPSHLNLLGLFGSVESDRGNQQSFLNEAPRPFIDAWSSSGNGVNVSDVNRSYDMASSSWTAPGGPLAEVLNLTSATTNITGQSSPVSESGDYGVGPSATSVSSPSGVLQRTLVSFSDGSGSSSPTLACSGALTPNLVGQSATALSLHCHGRITAEETTDTKLRLESVLFI